MKRRTHVMGTMILVLSTGACAVPDPNDPAADNETPPGPADETPPASGGEKAVDQNGWTPFFSEEGQYYQTCPADCGVNAVRATGDYADNLSLHCTPWAHGSLREDGSYWSEPFSEEGDTDVEQTQCILWEDGSRTCDTQPLGDNFHLCFGGLGPDNKGIVTGIACYGRYCDAQRIQCKKPATGRLGNCWWSGWFSEEQGIVDFGPNQYVTGYECSGRYCDNKSFYVCAAM